MDGEAERKTGSGAIPFQRRWLGLLLWVSIVSAAPILFGSLLLWGRMRSMREWQTMQGWRAVPATILSVKLQHQEKENSAGVPIDYYRLEAQYSYSWGGRQYHRSRVRVVDEFSSDPVMVNLERKLKQSRDMDKNVTCFVNPANPAEAVLFRDLPLGMYLTPTVLGGFCILIGVAFLAQAIYQELQPQPPRLHAASGKKGETTEKL